MAATSYTRRRLLAAGAALTGALAAPGVLRAQESEPALQEFELPTRNISSFRSHDWRDHFKTIDKPSMVADTVSRSLHYWGIGGEDYRIYPTSVPRNDALTRRGYTEVVRKKVGPSWTPTVNMRAEDPSLPTFMPAGPENPLGSHALYLSWPAYLIHGTHDTRKIGRRSSSGCIGLYNEMIAELYELAPIGTRVRLI